MARRTLSTSWIGEIPKRTCVGVPLSRYRIVTPVFAQDRINSEAGGR